MCLIIHLRSILKIYIIVPPQTTAGETGGRAWTIHAIVGHSLRHSGDLYSFNLKNFGSFFWKFTFWTSPKVETITMLATVRLLQKHSGYFKSFCRTFINGSSGYLLLFFEWKHKIWFWFWLQNHQGFLKLHILTLLSVNMVHLNCCLWPNYDVFIAINKNSLQIGGAWWR